MFITEFLRVFFVRVLLFDCTQCTLWTPCKIYQLQLLSRTPPSAAGFVVTGLVVSYYRSTLQREQDVWRWFCLWTAGKCTVFLFPV